MFGEFIPCCLKVTLFWPFEPCFTFCASRGDADDFDADDFDADDFDGDAMMTVMMVVVVIMVMLMLMVMVKLVRQEDNSN